MFWLTCTQSESGASRQSRHPRVLEIWEHEGETVRREKAGVQERPEPHSLQRMRAVMLSRTPGASPNTPLPSAQAVAPGAQPCPLWDSLGAQLDLQPHQEAASPPLHAACLVPAGLIPPSRARDLRVPLLEVRAHLMPRSAPMHPCLPSDTCSDLDLR